MSLSGGAAYAAPLEAGFFGGASGSLAWTRESVDGFTERIDDGERTYVFDDDDRTSVLSRIGVEVARPIDWGRVAAVPTLRAAWFHEFADDSRSIGVQAFDFVENPWRSLSRRSASRRTGPTATTSPSAAASRSTCRRAPPA